MCDEHARALELADESRHWDVAVCVTGDWLSLALAWGHEDLERLARNAHEEAKQEFTKADARTDLAIEIANGPRKGGENPTLSREQDEEVRRLIKRADAFTDAYTHIEDLPDDQIGEKRKVNILATLSEESERASQEAGRYKEELGL